MIKTISLVLMALLYVAAGLVHFFKPGFYRPIMPAWIPWHDPIIYFTGALEIALGLLVLPESTRFWACILLIALLVAIFPANIQMTINYWNANKGGLWLTVARLPLQVLLIWWAWAMRK